MLLSFSAASTLHLSPSLFTNRIPNPNSNPNFIKIHSLKSSHPFHSKYKLFCHSTQSDQNAAKLLQEEEVETIDGGNPNSNLNLYVGVGNPSFYARFGSFRMSLGDQAFFLLAFIACTTSIAFTSLVVAAIPTLYAMKRAATSLAKLADTAREEIPSTMTAIRLSGMEISDLTLELSDLSQEIAEGVNKSAKVVQAAEAGVRQIGALAHSKTMSMIEERANLPDISLQPVVVGAAKKTSNAVGHAKKTLMSIISGGGDCDSDTEKVEN